MFEVYNWIICMLILYNPDFWEAESEAVPEMEDDHEPLFVLWLFPVYNATSGSRW